MQKSNKNNFEDRAVIQANQILNSMQNKRKNRMKKILSVLLFFALVAFLLYKIV